MIKSPKEFIFLRKSENTEEYTRAANEEAQTHVWEELIRDYPDMRTWVAHNKTIPEVIIRKLAFDKDPHVRLTIAMKRKTPSDIKKALSQDECESVRRAIAMNKKTSQEILEEMLNDSAQDIVTEVKERLKNQKK